MRENLPRTKDGAYVINLDEKQSKEMRWISLFIGKHKAVYIASFEIENIPKEILSKIKDKYVTHNMFDKKQVLLVICYWMVIKLFLVIF